MTAPVSWISFWKPKDAWYYAGPERREALLARWGAIRQSAVDAGARVVGDYECRANTIWARMSVWEFPTLEPLLAMLDHLEEAEYYQYFADDNVLGRRTDEPFANYAAAARYTDEVT